MFTITVCWFLLLALLFYILRLAFTTEFLLFVVYLCGIWTFIVRTRVKCHVCKRKTNRKHSHTPRSDKLASARTKDLRHKLVLKWASCCHCCCSTSKMPASIDRKIYWFLETAKNFQTQNACKCYSAHTHTLTYVDMNEVCKLMQLNLCQFN